MPTLQIRNVPEELYRALKERAKREKRSLNSEAIIILAQGFVHSESEQAARYRDIIAQANALGRQNKAYHLPDAVEWVREDRER